MLVAGTSLVASGSAQC